MVNKKLIESRLKKKEAQLEAANDAYTALLNGQVKSYAMGSRNLSMLDLPQLESSIKKLEQEIENLENQLRGGSRRKAIGIVPRDL